MDIINIKTENLIKKSDKKNYYFKVVPNSINLNNSNNSNNSKYKIIINAIKPTIIQFKFNSKFIKKIIIQYNDINYSIENIPYEGVLTNCYLDLDKSIQISPIIDEECGQLNIFDIEILDENKLKPIGWEKIFIINLKRRTDRKNSMEKILNSMCLKDYEFVEAIDGQEPNILEEYDKLKQTGTTRIVNSGHYGCLLSHIKSIELAQKQNLKSVLILEDDIIFDENFYSILNSTLLPKHDMVYLGGIISEVKFFPLGWAKTNEIMGAYAYLIKSSMYKPILEKLYNKIYCVDIGYIEYIQPKYNVYILDDLVKTNLDSSDTSNKNKILIKLLARTYIKPEKI